MPGRRSVEYFWSRFDKGRGGDDCWLWTGARTRDPHGQPSYGVLQWQGEHTVVHRLVWRLTRGEIPEGMKVLHHCDVTNCGRPDHLFLGTQADNMQDRKRKGRHRFYPRRDPSTGRWLQGAGVPA